MTVTARPTQLFSVQALRGLAALLVVFMHTAAIQKEDLAADREAELSLLTGFWDQGYAGVDLFFVISGFIMVYVTQHTARGIGSSARFLFARASRIYPLWWVFLALTMFYFYITYGQVSQPNYGTDPDVILSRVLNSVFLTPQEALPILLIGWTLVHEMMFYVLFAVALLLPRQWGVWLLLLWAVLIGILFVPMGAPAFATNYAELIFSPLSLEFIMGALAAGYVLRGGNAGAKTAAAVGVAALCVTLVIGIDVETPSLVWKRVLFYGLPFAAILYGAVALERAGRLKTPPWLSRLGDWSYSLYLSHILVILALRRITEMAAPYLPEALRFQAVGVWDNVMFTLTAISAAVIFSALSYHLIEQPLLRGTRKLWRRKAVA